jgi:excisionase family DNA binding protein
MPDVLTSESKETRMITVNLGTTRGRNLVIRATASSPLALVDPDDQRPFKVEEAARLASLGINQTYAAIKRGDIPSIRVGNRILIPRKAFLAWLSGDSLPSASGTAG